MQNYVDDRKFALVRLCRMSGRVCPQPRRWQEFWRLIGEPEGLDVPLILNGWSFSTDRDKRERFEQHLSYAIENGMLENAEQFLTSLREDDWHTGRPYHNAPSYILPDPGVGEDPQWLQRLLQRAITEGWCLKMNCNTCASVELRGALGLLDDSVPLHIRPMSAETAEAIVDGLRTCTRHAASDLQTEEAMMWVLYEVWRNFGDRYFSKLDGSWAGTVLAQMQAHHQRRQEARRLHDSRQGVKMRNWKE